MAVNTSIYGRPENWYTVPKTFDTIKAANFTANAASVANARVAIAMVDGRIEPATLLDSSVATHAIPDTLRGHEWNTMFDVGGVNAKGGPDNCILAKKYGFSPAIIYRINSRSSGSGTECCPPIGGTSTYQWYNSPNIELGGTSIDNWDVNRMCPVTSIDFKKFVFAIVLQVCSDFTATEDSEGIKQVNTIPSSILIDLQAWLSDVIPSGQTKTYHELYPHICNVLLVPMYQGSGSEPSWDNFNVDVSQSNRLACIPNMLFDYTCAGWNSTTSRVTKENVSGVVLSNAVSWMDNMAISSSPITYMLNANQYNSLTIGTESCAIFNLFGMKGGNGTSYGIAVQNYISSRNDRYFVRTCRGFSHLDWAYSSSSSDRRSIFAWWKDQPEYPTPVDPSNPTAEELSAITVWKNNISYIIHTMVSYTGAMFQDSVYGYNQNPTQRFIGIINSSGISTGTFGVVTEETLGDFSQTASDNFIDDTPYDPSTGPDIYDYDSEIGVKNIQTGNIFCRAYAINNEVKGLSQYLWNTVTTDIHSAQEYSDAQKDLSSKFLNTNPVDNIVSLIYYPFNIKDQLGLTTQRAVGLGNQTVEYSIPGSPDPITLKGYLIGNNMQVLLDAGSLRIQPYFNDFRDYEPYTTLELFIPYHGSIALLNSEVLGYTLSVKIAVDLLTGSSTAFIFRDNLIIDQINGNMGVNIPINGLEQATYNANIYNANSNLKVAKINEQITNITSGFQIAGQAINTLNSGVMGNIPGTAISSLNLIETGLTSNLKSDLAAQQVANAQFNLDHTTKPIKNCGAPTGSNSTVGEQYCRLIIRRPYATIDSHDEEMKQVYADSVGYATYIITGQREGGHVSLKSFAGHIEMTNVKINGSMTSKEKELIKTALMNGVHIN